MRAIVLAAGLGTRFRPLSDVLPKPAAPILGEPLVRRTLRHLASQGVRAATVNTHHRPEDVVAACAEAAMPVRFQYEAEILGTGGAVARAAKWLWPTAESLVVVANGDMIFDLELRAVVAQHRRSGALATMVLRENPDPTRYGAVELGAHQRIVRLLGEPAARKPGRAFMFTGVHLLSAGFAPFLRAEPSCIVRSAYRALVDARGPVFGFVTDTPWFDIGTPADYLDANLALLGTRVVLATNAVVHAGARVRGSFLGADARVGTGARLDECVVWAGTRVSPGAHHRRAVLGPNLVWTAPSTGASDSAVLHNG